MTLRFVKTNKCPVCGCAEVVFESITTSQHIDEEPQIRVHCNAGDGRRDGFFADILHPMCQIFVVKINLGSAAMIRKKRVNKPSVSKQRMLLLAISPILIATMNTRADLRMI